MRRKNLFDTLSSDQRKRLKKVAEPPFFEPMLATLTNDYFSSDDWIYEPKLDGERCIAVKKNGKVTLMSRNKRIINIEYPELAQALADQKADNFIIDGEIVALDKNGVSDFRLLQSRINLQDAAAIKYHVQQTPVRYCIFDVTYADNYDLRGLDLLARKTILKKLLDYNDVLMYVDHQSPDGITYFKKACRLGWEGLIAKKSDSTYVGARSRNWLKFKCAVSQELIIVGYTDPQGSRTDFGALLVGYYDDKKLMYAGKVGSGFSHAVLKMLGKKLRAREIKTCPVGNYALSTRSVHWVKPELVAEFKFAQWTGKNRLRVPRYQGLRDDKSAQDVIKEKPAK